MNTATFIAFGNRPPAHGAAASLLSLSEHLALVDAFTRWAGFEVVFPGASGMNATMLNKMAVKGRLPMDVRAGEAAANEGHPRL